ncbi:hypothetical protein BASA81_002117 [Batrachochytrium salamandrivorans]|nr:hypothetical protein BASA81_002117 [Batrachochytrium salamandrivorans]
MSELAEILARRRLWEEETEARAASASHPPPPPPPSAPSIPKPPPIQKQILPKPTGARPMSTPVGGVGTSSFAPGIPASRPNSVPKAVAAGAKPPPASHLLRPVAGGGVKTGMLPPPMPLHHPPPPPAPSKASSFRAPTPITSTVTSSPPSLVGTTTVVAPKPAFVLRPASSRVLKQPSQSKLLVEHPPPPPVPSTIVTGTAMMGGRTSTGLRPDSWIKTKKDDANNVSMRDLIRKSNNSEQDETPSLSRRSSNSSDHTTSPPTFTFHRMGSNDLKDEPKKQLVKSSSSSDQRLMGMNKPNGLVRSDSKSLKSLTISKPIQSTVKQLDSKPPNSPLQVQPTILPTTTQQATSPVQKHVTSKEFAQSLGVMEDLRDKLVGFYELHNKLKLTSVDKILASFGMRGREQGEILLNQALMREYGVDLHTSSKTNLITFTKALYKFIPLQDGDLGFEAGQIIQVTDSSKDWWLGSYKLGDTTVSGVFPKNYVQDLSEEFVLETLAKQENTVKKTTVVAAAATKTSVESNEYSPEDVKEDIFASHYFKSVLEVVTSELKYVVDLFTVNEVFVTKFQNHPSKSKYAGDLFPSWISIVYAHENILGRLMEALPDSTQIAREFNKRTGLTVERKRMSGMGDSLIKQVCGDSGAKLSAFQDKLERLEDAFVLYLESGKDMSLNQRKLRIQTISEWVCRQSKELTNLIPFLKMSNQFILQYHATLKKLEQFTGEDLQFINKLEAHPVMKTMKLRDFLIKPIQRVCKYPLLYREIIKYAPEEETRQIAKATQDKFMSITEHVNLMIKQSELGNAKRLAELLTWVYPPTDLQRYELHVPHTLLTMRREGELVVTAYPPLDEVSLPTKQLTALLITDSLFLCDKQTITRLLAKPEQRLRIHHAIRFGSSTFDKITVTGKEEDLIEVCLEGDGGGSSKQQQTWIFKFPSQAGREGWLEDLNAAVERSEAVRNREREAHKQEQKIEKQRNARNSNPKPSTATAVPEPPRRLGVLMGLMDELKYVQVLKGVSKDEV